MKIKSSINLLPIIILSVGLLLFISCAPEEEVVINYVTEKSGSQQEEVTVASEAPEEDPEGQGIQQTEEPIENSPQGSIEDSTNLTFVSRFIGGNPGEMILNIDLESGIVSGTLEMESSEVYLEGTTSKVCIFEIEGEINGQIDPETRKITAIMDGEARSDERTCVGGIVQYETEAMLYENKKYVTGKFDTPTLDFSFVMERE